MSRIVTAAIVAAGCALAYAFHLGPIAAAIVRAALRQVL